MMNTVSLRRYAAYAGIALAAVASVATTQAPPEPDVVREGHDTLSSTAPEVSRHFTVMSGETHSVGFRAELDWGDVADDSPAAVVVRLTADGTSNASDQIGNAADGTSPLVTTVQTPCEAGPCTQGYTVVMRLLDAGAGDEVDVDWTLSVLDESGSSTPSVTED